ncbi:putative GTP-binding protein YjiA [Rosistilla ulvae]|uniref:Putative GTP-binding protein YjiA n=1 Tax=Rosistilla ulvae TaxID=1930277 RepID=A0A517LZC5_9BACT|nr:GTP-binding protein [Rosistilla ulvae]QDS87974.1 putative GTP-binding protein YjiA [Rosistilla ulvae]
MTSPIRFIMIGGFLGAGKTTLIQQLARRFQADGKHVCIVTNDQAAGLVDTELLKSQGFEVNEVAGSCFCCNFDGLTDAMDEFESRRRPDVILAEPVGSCTDLIATIAIPMMERLGEKFVHSPYAVILKPKHGLKILSGTGGGFSEKAEYIFRKQLEESEIILLNRIDELSDGEVDELKARVDEQYPGRQVICISAKTGENLDALYEAFQQLASPREATMEVDYDVYADGEAELGWLNATAVFESPSPMPLDRVAVELVEHLRQSLSKVGAEPGHLKVLCSGNDDVSVANLIDSDSATVLSVSSAANAAKATAIINARVRLAPEELRQLVDAAVSATAAIFSAQADVEQLESFRPGRPTPTHRVQY